MTVRQISGERRIPWAMLVSIAPQNEACWKQYQQSGLERIGVDFDFDSQHTLTSHASNPELLMVAKTYSNGRPIFTRDSLIALKKLKTESQRP